MIVLSAGMPRAGSGWYYNLTNELVIAAGYQDGREIRSRYHLQRILTEVNCNIGALTAKRLVPVMVPSVLGNIFVIKAHAGPTPFAQRLVRSGQLLPAYIYRDPRDAMLSAYEYGQRALQKSRPNAFSHLTDFDKTLEFILEYIKIWKKWVTIDDALHTRYEDLKRDYDGEVKRLVEFLKLDGDNPSIKIVTEQYRPELANSGQAGTHFSKGVSGRFLESYSIDQQEKLNQILSPHLRKMGYE